MYTDTYNFCVFMQQEQKCNMKLYVFNIIFKKYVEINNSFEKMLMILLQNNYSKFSDGKTYNRISKL